MRAQRRSSQAVPAAARLRAGRRQPLRARRRAAPPRMRRHFPSRQGFKPSGEGLEMLLREGESTAGSRGRLEPPGEQLEPSRGEGVGCAEELLAAANSPFPPRLAEAARAQRRVRNRRDHGAELSWGRTPLSRTWHSERSRAPKGGKGPRSHPTRALPGGAGTAELHTRGHTQLEGRITQRREPQPRVT